MGRGKRATKLRQGGRRKERQSDHAPDLAPLAHTSVIIQTQRGAYQRRSDSESSESSSGSSSRSCSGDQLAPRFCGSSITSSPPSSAGRGASASRMRRASSASSRRTASRTGYRFAIDGIIPPALSRITADGMLWASRTRCAIVASTSLEYFLRTITWSSATVGVGNRREQEPATGTGCEDDNSRTRELHPIEKARVITRAFLRTSSVQFRVGD